MSFYKELVEQTSLVGNLERECTEEINPRDVAGVYLRMGKIKFGYVSELFNLLFPNRVFRLEAEEKEKNYQGFAKPEWTAAVKARELEKDIRLRLRTESDIPLNPEQLVLSIGQDVVLCNELGTPFYKPKADASKSDIFYSMITNLCDDGSNVFRLKSGLAVYGRDGFSNIGSGRGVMVAAEKRFTIDEPFSRKELELYAYGLAGENNDYPDYLEAELKRLCQEGWIKQEELGFYSRGLTVQELRQTNGGFRWPHPVFMRHIVEIDGIKRDSESFDQKRLELFLSLMGVIPESIIFMEEIIKRIRNNDKERWQQLFISRSGSLLEVRPINLEDEGEVAEVSALVQQNFRHHKFYRDLGPAAVLEYCISNNEDGIRQTCSHPDNLMTAVVIGNGRILGYCVVRIDERNGRVAQIRRLHTEIGQQGMGVATYLIEQAKATAFVCGFSKLTVIASGHSDEFFLRRGFVNNDGTQLNRKLQKRGVKAPVSYCTLQL